MSLRKEIYGDGVNGVDGTRKIPQLDMFSILLFLTTILASTSTYKPAGSVILITRTYHGTKRNLSIPGGPRLFSVGHTRLSNDYNTL